MSPSGAYLDHAASTPVMPEVLDAMLVHLRDNFANPSGTYRQARNERRAIDDARDVLGELFACAPAEVIFTSGGTEADNLALIGPHRSSNPGSVVVSAIEHHAVLRPAESINARVVPVTAEALIDLDSLKSQLRVATELVSIMAVNNEVGTIQPMAEIVDIVHEYAPDALIHCDAVQALAWCDVATMTTNCDLVTISGHKVGAPKGVGALIVRERARQRMAPLVRGGSQERELRAGTENVAGIVALATAAQLTVERQPHTIERVRALRDRFVDMVANEIPSSYESVPRHLRHVGNAHMCFPGTTNEEFLLLLDERGVAASAGSSCASGALEPSHVLLAMGMGATDARSCIRFTLGATTTSEEIDYAVDAVKEVHAQLLGGVTDAG